MNRTFGVSMMLVAVALLAACHAPSSPPAATADASPAPQPSAATSTQPAAVSPTPGSGFREDFGGGLDPAVWALYEQAGLGVVRDGKLELLSTNGQTTFPYVVTRQRIVPEKGGFAFELVYRFAAPGRGVSFCLDYLPPEEPGQDGLTIPFMRSVVSDAELKLMFDTEKEDPVITAPFGASSFDWHTLRLECDGAGRYKVLGDGKPLGEFSSNRRPEKFWIGVYPQRPAGYAWPRLQIDSVSVDAR